LVGGGGKNGTQGLDEALAEMAKRLSVFLSFAIWFPYFRNQVLSSIYFFAQYGEILPNPRNNHN